MSMMRDALETLRGWRAEHATVEVEYYFVVSSSTKTIQATKAATTVTLDDGETISKSKVIDWLIDIDQQEIEPFRGDAIVFENERYVVADIGSEHCWRWHDSLNRTRRIHTKAIPN